MSSSMIKKKQPDNNVIEAWINARLKEKGDKITIKDIDRKFLFHNKVVSRLFDMEKENKIKSRLIYSQDKEEAKTEWYIE